MRNCLLTLSWFLLSLRALLDSLSALLILLLGPVSLTAISSDHLYPLMFSPLASMVELAPLPYCIFSLNLPR